MRRITTAFAAICLVALPAGVYAADGADEFRLTDWYGAGPEDYADDFDAVIGPMTFQDGDGSIGLVHIGAADRMIEAEQLLLDAPDPALLIGSDTFTEFLAIAPRQFAGHEIDPRYRHFLKTVVRVCNSTDLGMPCQSAHLALGKSYQELGDPERAMTVFRASFPAELEGLESFEWTPQSSEMVGRLIEYYGREGRTGEQLELVRFLMKAPYGERREQEEFQRNFVLGKTLIADGQHREAAKVLGGQVDIQDRYDRTRGMLLAEALAGDGKNSRAIRLIEDQEDMFYALPGIKNHGELDPLAELKARILREAGKQDEALEAIRSVVNRYGRMEQLITGGIPMSARLEYARLMIDQGEVDTARRIFERYQLSKLDPDFYWPLPLSEREELAALGLSGKDKGYEKFVTERLVERRFRELRWLNGRIRGALETEGSSDRARRYLDAALELAQLPGLMDYVEPERDPDELLYSPDPGKRTLERVRRHQWNRDFADGDFEAARPAYRAATKDSYGDPSGPCDVTWWWLNNPYVAELPASGLVECTDGIGRARLMGQLHMVRMYLALWKPEDPKMAAIASRGLPGFQAMLREFVAESDISGSLDALVNAPKSMADEDDAELLRSALDSATDASSRAGDMAIVDQYFRAFQEILFDDTAFGVAASHAINRASQEGPELGAMAREYFEIAARVKYASRRQKDDLEKLDTIRKAMLASAPDFFSLTMPQSLGIERVQQLLGPDEMLLQVMPSPAGSVIVAISSEDARIARGNWSEAQIDRAVMRLRWDVGANVNEPAEIEARWLMQAGDGYSFERDLAHDLYREIFGPIEDMIEGKRHIFAIADGSLSTIPFSILVRSQPEGDDADPEALRRTDWVADAPFSLAHLPSVQMLELVRGSGRVSGAKSSAPDFSGFGAPALGPAEATRGATGTNGRRGNAAVRAAFGRASSVSELASLPGTIDELEAMREALGAEADRVLLSTDATEPAVRRTIENGARILHFATHGLVPGDMVGLNEAALVLTPPSDLPHYELPGGDNGLLTSREIAEMNLLAEWVILSACNSAVQTSGEGFGGLPTAFLYAGSRNLLATHWPVLDDVAKRISVDTVISSRGNAVSRAEALKQAMKTIRDDRTAEGRGEATWAHPSAWAPFVLIGDASAN